MRLAQIAEQGAGQYAYGDPQQSHNCFKYFL